MSGERTESKDGARMDSAKPGAALNRAIPPVLPTAKMRVQRRIPSAGAELSAMHGWRIVDYRDHNNPVALNRGCKTEAAAWRSVDQRGVVR